LREFHRRWPPLSIPQTIFASTQLLTLVPNKTAFAANKLYIIPLYYRNKLKQQNNKTTLLFQGKHKQHIYPIMPPKSKPKRKTPTTTDNNVPKKKIARGTDEWAEMYRKKNAQSQQKVGEQVKQGNNAPTSSVITSNNNIQLKPPTPNPKPPTAIYRLPPADANASQHSLASYISYRNSMSVYQPTNAIDEVMNEVQQLLQAASEAQALGRLRNSYSSLLLAHQRLVGLGSRVDRSYCEAETPTTTQPTTQTTTEGGECSNLSITSQQLKQPTFLPPLVSQPPLPPSLTQNNYTGKAALVLLYFVISSCSI